MSYQIVHNMSYVTILKFELFDNFRSVLDIEVIKRAGLFKLLLIILELYFMQRMENNYAKNGRK